MNSVWYRECVYAAGLNDGPILVLITKRYPFSGYVESFLDEELAYINERFSQVVFCHMGKELDTARAGTSRLSVPYQYVSLELPQGLDQWKIAKDALLGLRLHRIVGDMWLEWRARRRQKESERAKTWIWKLLKMNFQIREAARRLSSELDRREVIFYSYWFAEGAYVACELGRIFTSRAVCRAHAFDVYSDEYGYICFHDCSIRGLAAVYSASELGAAVLRAELPQHVDKIHVAYLGTSDHGIQPLPRRGSVHIVSCAQISAVKRIDLLVEALSRLEGLDVRWTHIGGGSVEDFDRLISLANMKLGSGCVTATFTGYLSNVEVVEFYRTNPVDLFVNTSVSEGVPVAIREALSFGIPVAAPAVGGIPEIVVPGSNGFLLDRDAVVEELISTIHRISSMSRSEILRLRAAARRSWESQFSAEGNYRAFYDEIAGTP